MAKRGRPVGTEVKLDLVEVEKLCGIGCTQHEIADFFGISRATIERRASLPVFRAAMDRGYAACKVRLRRQQIQLAGEGNATMQIWLGKQLLGQRDYIDTKITGSGPDGEVQINVGSTAAERIASRIAVISQRRAISESTEGDK
jgi:hypothetical protein